MRWARLAVVAALVTIGAGVYPAAAANRQVYIDDNGPTSGKFYLAESRITQGDTVFWLNRDDLTHTATADDGSWTTGNIAPGDERSHTFNAPGRIGYHCAIHPSMKGTLEVVASTAPPATTSTTRPAGTIASTASTARRTATTVRSTTATSRSAAATSSTSSGPTTTGGFGALAPTSTTEDATPTTAGQVAIKQAKNGGGTSAAGVVALLVTLAAFVGAGGYAIYRLRGGSA